VPLRLSAAVAMHHQPPQCLQDSQSASEASFCSAQSKQQEEVCLSPLSRHFWSLEQPPDIYAIMTVDGYCTLEELVKPMQLMADLHDR
jgi:hypothetical protein